MTYSATFKSGLPVPRKLIGKSTAKDLPLLFERLRDVVEADNPMKMAALN